MPSSATTFSEPRLDDTVQRLVWKLAALLGVPNARLDDTLQRLLYRIAVHIGADDPRMDDMTQRLLYKIAVAIGALNPTIQDSEQRLLWKIAQHYGVTEGCCGGLGDNSQRLLWAVATMLSSTPPVPPVPPALPEKPINPDPADAAPAVDPTAVTIQWANGGGATSYDVWFNGVLQGNQPGTSFLVGALAASTAYTWRIDAVNADGTTTGDTWTFTTAAPPEHPQVADWAGRVTGAGGAEPSAATRAALSNFMYALDAASLTAKMISVNCIVPDSLTAMRTPLIANAGNTVYTNVSYADANLSVNGLTSQSGRRLLTGLNPALLFTGATVHDCGMTAYVTSNTGHICREQGASTKVFGLNNEAANIKFNLSALRFGAAIKRHAYWSGNVLPGNLSIYAGDSGGGHVAEYVDAFLPPPDSDPAMDSNPLPLIAFNNDGFYQASNGVVCSFFALHYGLVEAESLAFFNAVQALRVAIGGGYA